MTEERVCQKALAALNQIEGVRQTRQLCVIRLGRAAYAVYDPADARPGPDALWVSLFDNRFNYLSTGGA